MADFNLWAGACSHVHTDVNPTASMHEHDDPESRESFADPIRQSEGYGEDAPGFEWDIMLHLGDLCKGEPEPPDDAAGREVHRQWSALREHRREQIYTVLGNHDASGLDDSDTEKPSQWWFREWIDPLGEYPETSGIDPNARPFPVNGTWERYSFQAGNILFLLLGDRNDLAPPIGKTDYSEESGFPAGAVTEETFEWWREMVETNQDKIIVTGHHHMLKDTTIASGHWEGITGNYHGYTDSGAPAGSGYLYFVGDDPDATAFEEYLADNPGCIDLWLGGHTHALPGDRYGGKSHFERKWDVTFCNVAPMTKHHCSATVDCVPLTRLFTFHEDEALASVQCYLHTDDFASIGWYDDAYRNVPLRHRFSGIE